MIKKSFRSFLKKLINLLLSSEFVQSIVYDRKNVRDFGNLHGHEKMLADSTRMHCYHEAIKRYIKPEDVVIDLGAGTGILSFLASQQNPKMVYAVEHSDIIRIAKLVGDHNNRNNIKYVCMNSRDFQLEEKVDVILHDQIGAALFNENMVENVLDLRKRLLKNTGRIIPNKFELFLEPACIKEDHLTPYIWENNLYGIDFGVLKNTQNISLYQLPHYHRRAIENNAIEFYLCKPKPILRFDLAKLNDADEIPRFYPISKTVIRSGHLDGFCFYFRVIFDDDLYLTTSPLQPRKNWIHIFFRTERSHYEIGDKISYHFKMENLIDIGTWSLSLQ